jgi:hypothetical protein
LTEVCTPTTTTRGAIPRVCTKRSKAHLEHIEKKPGRKNVLFAWDWYRRFVAMYGDVFFELKPLDRD